MGTVSFQPPAQAGHRDFNLLWVGQTISMVGSQITFLALPLTAAIVLGAKPFQMGLLSAFGSAPALLFGLLAGVWVDQHKRRPVLIAADLGRAIILAMVPLAALMGTLKLEVLYIVSFLAGSLGLLFNIAYRSYLPGLVGREQLIQANSRLELSNSVAEIIGPGIAGGLVQTIGAPIAIALDAISFLVSAITIGSIRTPETALAISNEKSTILKDIKDGLHLVFGEPNLRALAGCIGSLSLFNAIFESVQILYLTRQVGLSAGWLGVIFAAGSIGFVIGALVAGKVTYRYGLGRSLILGVLITGGSDLLIPLAGSLHSINLAVIVMILAQFIFGLGLTIFQIGQVSLRQSLTPDKLLGRMNATLSMITWGIVPLGGLVGGVIGQLAGLSPTLILAAVGEMMAASWLMFSPVKSIKQAQVL
jgi:MFS family permease